MVMDVRMSVILAVMLFAAPGIAQETAVKEGDPELPPRVVKVSPAHGDKNVDFNLREISVTFDRPMRTEQSWSWIIHEALGVYPGSRSLPHWSKDAKTCILPVRLSPDTLYAVGANSFRHTGFRDKSGKVAVPYVWVFKTGKGK